MGGIKMKNYVSYFCVMLILTSIFTSCKEQEIIFPPAEENTDKGVIDLIAKPTGTQIVGDYDYTFNIVWPDFSDNVEKVVITYQDNGEAKTDEFTDFSQNGVIQTAAQGSVEFEMTTHSVNGLVSKPVQITAVNKGYIIEEIIENAMRAVEGGIVDIRLINDNELPITAKVIYPEPSGGTAEYVVTSQDAVINLSYTALDGTHNYTIELEDEQGRKTSKEYSYTFEYIVSTQLQVLFNESNLVVSNNANVEISQVKLTYPTASGNQIKEVINIASGSTIKFPAITGNNLNVSMEYEDAVGRTLTRSLVYSYNPILVNHNTAELRAGWTPYASNSNSTSEGPPHFMLDGNSGTIWHTQWSTTITSDHRPDQKYPFTLIFTFTKSRGTSASGLYNEEALMNPVGPYSPILATEISLLHRAANNRRVKDVHVYGIDLEGNEIDFGQFELSNSVQETVLPLMQHGSVNSTPLKAVKVICLTTFSATDQFANFNEIYVNGYIE